MGVTRLTVCRLQGLRRSFRHRCTHACTMHRRRVMAEPITYVGLDVHKETIAVALAAAGKRGENREYGTIANTPAALKTLASKLAKSGATLHFCYEAGPCGS